MPALPLEYYSGQGIFITWDYSHSPGVTQANILRSDYGRGGPFELIDILDFPDCYYIDDSGTLESFYKIVEIDSIGTVVYTHPLIWGEEAFLLAGIFYEIGMYMKLRSYRERLIYSRDRTTARTAMGNWNLDPTPMVEIKCGNSDQTGGWAQIGRTIDVIKPTTLTTTASSGGTLSPDTYYYTVSSSDGINYTEVSDETSGTTDSSDKTLVVKWDAVPGAMFYRVWRGTATDAETQYFDTYQTTFRDNGSQTWTNGTPNTDLIGNTTNIGGDYPNGIKYDLDYNGRLYFLDSEDNPISINPYDDVVCSFWFKGLSCHDVNVALRQALHAIVAQPGLSKITEVGYAPVHWDRAIICGAAGYLLRQVALQLTVPEMSIFYTTDQRDPESVKRDADSTFEKINGKSKEYLEEFKDAKEQIKIEKYPQTYIITTPEFQLPGGRARMARMMYKSN